MVTDNLDFLQSIDKKIVSYDNILNFKFLIKNKGFNTIKNILFNQETNLNQEKVFLSTTKDGQIFEAKIDDNIVYLGDLHVGSTIEVNINVVINIPFTSECYSIGHLEFLNIEDKSFRFSSNPETFSFKGADFQNLGEVKFYFEKEYATTDEEINVGIDIENKGNSSGEKVIIGDIIPDGTSYVEGSIMINENNLSFDGALESINIGTVHLFQRVSIKYKIKVNSTLKGDILKHKVTLKYENKLNEDECYNKIVKSNESSLNIKLVKVDDFKKVCSKKEATIGDKVTFTVEGKNTGNIKLYDIILKDKCSKSYNIINESIIINGVKAYNKNLEQGILLETLNVLESFLIQYDAIIVDFEDDTSHDIPILMFKYDIDEKEEFKDKTLYGKSSKLLIKAPDLKTSTKSLNKSTAFLGDEVTTRISLRNTGNIRCENINIKDSIPDYLEFIPNSLFIDSEKIYSSSLGEVNIGYINSKEIKEISYRAKVCDIPKYNKNKNKVNLFYTYTIDGKNCSKEIVFYGEELVVNGALIKKKNIVKTVDRLYGIIGDELNYNLTFKNEGNFSCEKLFIQEEENRNLEFIPNSLNINGIETPYNIYKGFLYGELDGGASINLTFRCKIKSIPYSSSIQGLTEIYYEYRGENGTKKIKNTVTCKSEDVIVKSAIIDNTLGIFTKETPNNAAKSGERIPIRLHLRNMGNTEAYNVVLIDKQIKGIEIVENSITINGKTESYGDGVFNLGNLKVNEERELLYFAKITKECPNYVEANAEVNYSFYGNDGGTLIKSKGFSKNLSLNIFNPSLLMTESVNKDSLEVGEILNYNLYVSNNGNIDLRELKLFLDLDNREGIYLNELTINRRVIIGATLDKQISLPNIGKDESILICMKISLNKLLMKNSMRLYPRINLLYEGEENILTNVEFTGTGREISISLNTLNISKSTAKKTYLKGEKIHNLITVRNDGTNAAENIVVYDSSIGEGFIEDSLTINGYPVEMSFISGIPIGTLKQGECVFIRYSSLYEDDYTKNSVRSVVRVSSEFLDSKYGYMKKEFFSEEFSIYLVKASLKLIKTADKKVLAYGDKVNFITTIENNGTIPLFELNFSEDMEKGFIPITSSIFVNGSKVIKGDSKKGLPLPPLEPKSILEVSTQYEYKNYKRMQRLSSESLVSYAYELEGNKDIYIGERKSNRVFLEGEIATFRNFTIDHDILLNDEDVWIGEVTDVIVVPKITKSYVVKTINNTSLGNESLTGYKLIIRGILEEKIEYIANTEEESVHMVIHEERFSTSIILPKQHDLNEEVNLDSIVHQVFHKVINDKQVQLSINLTVQGLI
ncbi:MAG: hypothetical protein ACRCWM_07775 [Sarcina sp.]|uniref:hypothetical protein n=1 Tax=Clostridium sp. TaxID=1506 RepID=UPI003F3CD51D